MILYLLVGAGTLFVSIRTISFAIWTFKNNETVGGIFLLILSALCILPVFTIR